MHDVAKQFHSKIAQGILELIILICFSMLRVYQYVYLKTDFSLLSFPI